MLKRTPGPRLVARVFGIAMACSVSTSAAKAQSTTPAKPFPVGFRTVTITDGARGDVHGRAVRTLPAFVWYPASATDGRRASFGFWIDQLAFNNTATTHSGDSIFVRRAADLGGNADSLWLAMPRLRQLATSSAPNAAAASGRFPLIVFPEYSAPATTSVLAEHLASCGYVVVSIPLMGTVNAEPDISTRGLETVALDVMATVQHMKQLSHVDGRRIGAVGVGITASALLTAHLMSPDIQSLVSLEGGITTQFEMDMIRRSPYFDPGRVRAPLLAITAPHASVDVRRLDVYAYAPQVRLHYGKMGEFWFLNYGWLDQYRNGIIGQPPGNPITGFTSALAEIERFFDATLRQSEVLSPTSARKPASNSLRRF